MDVVLIHPGPSPVPNGLFGFINPSLSFSPRNSSGSSGRFRLILENPGCKMLLWSSFGFLFFFWGVNLEGLQSVNGGGWISV